MQRIAHRLGHRQRFAGDGAFIHLAGAIGDHPVQRHPRARPQQQMIAHRHLCHRNLVKTAVAAQPQRGFRPQRHQRIHRRPRPPHSAMLEHARRREQRQQHRPFQCRPHGGGGKRCDHHQQINIQPPTPKQFAQRRYRRRNPARRERHRQGRRHHALRQRQRKAVQQRHAQAQTGDKRQRKFDFARVMGMAVILIGHAILLILPQVAPVVGATQAKASGTFPPPMHISL